MRRSRRAPTPCCARRSCTTARSPSARSRRLLAADGLPGTRDRMTRRARRSEGTLLNDGWGSGADEPAALSGFFHVPGRGACIAIRGGRDARLVAAGPAAGGRPLGPATSDAGGRGILELLAHAIELCRVLRAEPASVLGRLLTVTSTTTTHRRCSIAAVSRSPAGRGFPRLGGQLRSVAAVVRSDAAVCSSVRARPLTMARAVLGGARSPVVRCGGWGASRRSSRGRSGRSPARRRRPA